ncbi:MAG: nicotinate-nucleotide adenylyltransferase [Acidobacteriota bacterium]
MKRGLYGGSFDPIHRGHVDPVRSAARHLLLDRVTYLPTGRPPHKRDARMASPHRRYAMVELALLGEPDFDVSTFELESSTPSYTVDTLERARDTWPDDELFLILGGDSFANLDTWYRFPDLPELAELIVLRRGGEALPERGDWHPVLRDADDRGRLHIVDNPTVDAASSAIRRHLRSGEAVPAGWMAPTVLSYIDKYGLYRAESTRVDALAASTAPEKSSPT